MAYYVLFFPQKTEYSVVTQSKIAQHKLTFIAS